MSLLKEKIQQYIASQTSSEKFDSSFMGDEKCSIRDILDCPILINNIPLTFSTLNTKFFRKKMEVVFNQMYSYIDYTKEAEDLFVKLVGKNMIINQFIIDIVKKEESLQDRVYAEINNLKILDKICKQNNVDPWRMLNLNGYEVFLPANVLTNQLMQGIKMDASDKDSFDEKVDFFLDNLDKWVNKSGKFTNYKQINARCVLPFLYSRSVRDINSFFDKTGLNSKDVDVNTEIKFKDSLLGTFHSRSALNGKYVFLNKFSSQKNDTAFELFINSEPYKKDLITNKKAFFKELKNTNITFSKEDFKSIFNRLYKKARKKYDESEYSVRCYFPFKLSVIDNWEKLTHKDINTINTIGSSSEHLLNLVKVAVEKHPDIFISDSEFLINSVLGLSKIADGKIAYRYLKKDDEENFLFIAVKKMNLEDKEKLKKALYDNMDAVFNVSAMKSYKNSINSGFAFNIPIHDVLIELVSSLKISTNEILKIEKIYENFKSANTIHYTEMRAALLTGKLISSDDNHDELNIKAKVKI